MNLEDQIKQIVKNIYGLDVNPVVSRTDPEHGDYASNVALQIAKQVVKNPREVADMIASKLVESGHKADVAGPGFINIHLSDQTLLDMVGAMPKQTLQDKVIICEYSDMNAFKTAHVGHLYTTLVGNAISNLHEAAGAKVIRANFGGDVGLHVGKAMWAIMNFIQNDLTNLGSVAEAERSGWVAARYVEGNTAYEDNDISKAEIIEVNKKVYELHVNGDKLSAFAQVYWACRQWSYDGFEAFYDLLQLDKQPDGAYFVYYPESETAPFGKALVEKGIEQGVFSISDGAAVYVGEPEGLHTRVFLTAQGLPTYETKDLGLAVKKWQDYKYDSSVIITANDISEYMKVILSALRKLLPIVDGKTRHVTHGLVKLAGGQKMSSRKGNVLLPEDVIEAAKSASQQTAGKVDMQTVLGAIKYAFLKNKIGGDVIYDPIESISIQGNSGPYLQYAHARACSIIAKLDGYGSQNISKISGKDLQEGERLLVKKLGEYAEVVDAAVRDITPHVVCTYLYELAQEFNRFYENNRVIGDERQALRLVLVTIYRDKLATGLKLLGITAPDKM